MLTLSITEVILLGASLFFASWVIRPAATAHGWRSNRITIGLRRPLKLFGLAALIAAVILLCLPVLKPVDLSNESLSALNETLERYHHLLEKCWWILLGLILSFLASIWLGWLRFDETKARATRKAVNAVSAVKVLITFLACFSFVGAGLEHRVNQRIADVEDANAHLEAVQVELFLKIRHVIQREAIAETVQSVSDESPQFASLRNAYQVVAAYVPSRGPIDPDINEHKQTPTGSPDRSQAPDSNNIFVTDLTPTAAEAMSSALDAEIAGEPRDSLVEDAVHLVFDNTASNSIKEYILHIGNPVLSEFVSALLDPAFGEPAENWINQRARAVMQSAPSFESLRQSVRTNLASMRRAVAQRVAEVARYRGEDFTITGEPEWNTVRENLSAAIVRGLRGKPEEIQDEARASISHFDVFWRAAGKMYANGTQQAQEQIFSEYLAKNPDYAALWGYAVISFTPERYKGDLQTIAIGRLGEIETALRRLVGRKDGGSLEAASQLDEIDPEHKLQFSSPSRLYRQVWYEHDGAHPVDGYVLYTEKVGTTPPDMAASYFDSEPVGKFVGDYCPRPPRPE